MLFSGCFILLIQSLSLSAELIAPTRSLEGQSEEMGKLSVSSDPPGLEVALDGKGLGKTPLIDQAVTAGDHILSVKDAELEIFVLPGKTLQFALHKGSLIEIPERKQPKQPQPETEVVTQPVAGKKSAGSTEDQKKLDPLYFPLNPGGPIY